MTDSTTSPPDTYDEFLAHYGVKGMRWGVRKDADGKARVGSVGEFGENGNYMSVQGRKVQPFTNQLRRATIAAGLGVLNNSSKYKGKTLKPGSKLAKEYEADMINTVRKSLTTASIVGGVGRTGLRIGLSMIGIGVIGAAIEGIFAVDGAIADTPRYQIANSDGPDWAKDLALDWKDAQAKHSSVGNSETRVLYERYSLKRDDLGHVVDVTVLSDDVKHAETLDESLAHFGVKGMRWGVRRSDAVLESVRNGGTLTNEATGESIQIKPSRTVGGADRKLSKAASKLGMSKESARDDVRAAIERGRSDDSAVAKASLQKARKDGVKALSNTELKALNERLNLEQNFAKLTYKPAPEPVVKKLVKGAGKTLKFLNGPGKPLVNAVASQFKAANAAKTAANAAGAASAASKAAGAASSAAKSKAAKSAASAAFTAAATAGYAYASRARAKNGSDALQITDSNVVEMFLGDDGVYRAR